MESEAVEFVVAVFEGVDSAESVLKVLISAVKEKKFKIEAALAMSKDRQGVIRYKDVGLTPAKGALGGLVLGGVVSLLTGGAGLVLGALGGLAGGMLGRKKRDSRFASAQVNQVLAAIAPGSSALLMVVEYRHLAALEAALEDLGADVFAAVVPDEMVAELQKNQEAAFSALASNLEKPSAEKT